MTETSPSECPCVNRSPENYDGPVQDCPEHGNPAILGYDPNERRELRARFDEAIRPTMLLGLQGAELDGPGGAQRIGEWAEMIAGTLAIVAGEEISKRTYNERTHTNKLLVVNERLRAELAREEGQAVVLGAKVTRLRAEQAEAAAWLVRAGYPVDWSTHEPPPAALREAVIDAVHADPDGTIHGSSTPTREETAQWLAIEVRSFTTTEGTVS